MNQVYLDTARRQTQVAPRGFADHTFALKDATAISLFIRDVPRLSADPDLVFIDHRMPRARDLMRIGDALRVIVPETQYFDKSVLTKTGVTTEMYHDVNMFGFEDTKRFSKSLLDAVTHVSSTGVGDDCGVGFQPPSDWERRLRRSTKR